MYNREAINILLWKAEMPCLNVWGVSQASQLCDRCHMSPELCTTINYRAKEAYQPQFPIEICSISFNLVANHLQTLDYDGPLALSCNDTKLHTTFHLYWDSKKQAHFLVGSIDGPLLVLDPEVMKEVIDSAKAQKAVKVVSL